MDVVSAIGEAAFFALDVTKERAPDDDAFEPAIDNDTGGRQCRIPPVRNLNRDGMEPLDLSTRAPRSPRVRLAGLYMLARTIDKLRATLPGGNLGPYQLAGFSERLLAALGIAEDDIRAVVALAKDDDEVASWVLKYSDQSKYPEINARLEAPTVGERLDRPDFLARYPIIEQKRLPAETTLLEMLELDDAAMFEIETGERVMRGGR